MFSEEGENLFCNLSKVDCFSFSKTTFSKEGEKLLSKLSNGDTFFFRKIQVMRRGGKLVSGFECWSIFLTYKDRIRTG